MSTAAAPTAPTPILLDAEEVLLVHDAASVFHIKDITMNHYYTMTAAVVPIVDVHSTGVFGHRPTRQPTRSSLQDRQDCRLSTIKTKGSHHPAASTTRRASLLY